MIKLRKTNRTFILTVIEPEGIRELSFPTIHSAAMYCKEHGIK